MKRNYFILGLIFLLSPVSLAGCSFGKTTPQKSLSGGQLWYAIDSKDSNTVDTVSMQKGNKLRYIDIDDATVKVRYSDIRSAKTLSQVEKILKQKKVDYKVYSVKCKYDIFVDESKKTQKELIVAPDPQDNLIAISSDTVTLENGELSGFKEIPESESALADNNDHDYFVTKAKNVELDNSKNKNVTVLKNDEAYMLIDSGDGYSE